MAAVLLKEIELTPDDIVQAVRSFDPNEFDNLQHRLQAEGLFLERTRPPYWELSVVEDAPEAPADDDEPAFWKLIDTEPLPEPPPPTPEGDQIALAALDKIHGLFPITDPELGRWIAESEEVAIYNAYLLSGKESPELEE